MLRRSAFGVVAAGLTASLAAATIVMARDNLSPEEWLQKMSSAIQTLDYEGTVIRRQNGTDQPLKVYHKNIDGVINERIVVQEGAGLELIRVGEEVHCIVPDKKKVLIETWDSASLLFSALPGTGIEPGSQYDLLILSEDNRVAGRNAVLLAIRPNDSNRYEHRLWLDRKTGLPLRAEMIGLEGRAISELKFADIRIDRNIARQSLEPSVDLGNFTWYTMPGNTQHKILDTDWVSDALPPGFRTLTVSEEHLTGSDFPVTHIVFSDGIARVSVFISAAEDGEPHRSEVRGASSSYSTEIGEHRITAVGEVPPETVKAIATSMRRL